MALRVLQHLQEHAELNAVRMGLDLAWRRRQFVIGPRILFRLAFRGMVDEPHVRIGNRSLFEPLINRRSAFLILSFDLERDLRSLWPIPLDLFILMHKRFILLRVDLHLEEMRGRSGARS